LLRLHLFPYTTLFRSIRFFFRDNNVGREDERLYEMLDVFAAHEIPIDLGVITDLLSDSLARNLQARLVASNRRLALHAHKVIGRSEEHTSELQSPYDL